MGNLDGCLTLASNAVLIPLANIFIKGTRLAGLPVKYNSSFLPGTGSLPTGRIGRNFTVPLCDIGNDPAPWCPGLANVHAPGRVELMRHNTLYYGDCLEVMTAWPDACVDLIYLDPPFNSNADYNILFGNQKTKTSKIRRKDLAQITAFTDTWEWSEKTAKRIGEIKKAPAHCARKAVMALDSFYDSGTGMLAYLVYMADRINEMHRILKDTGSIYLHCEPDRIALLENDYG